VDSTLVAVGTIKGDVEIWDLQEFKLLRRISAHGGQIVALCFSPEGARLATSGREDKRVKIWGISSGEQIAGLDLKDAYAASIAFVPDGSEVVVGRGDGRLAFWGGASEHRLVTMGTTGTQGIAALVYTPDGRTLITSNNDGLVSFRNAATGQVRFPDRTGDRTAPPIAVSRDGYTLAIGGIGEIGLFRVATGEKILNIRVPWQATVCALGFEPNSRTLVSDSVTRRGEHELQIHSGPIDQPVPVIEE
jgi:WD40 repeat protein